MYRKISDYAIIGNTLSAALVSSEGSIDWCCLPRFDSPALFLRILDESKGGFCAVRVDGLKSTQRRYLEQTNILRTSFQAETGDLEVTDFMPLRHHRSANGGDDVKAEPQIIRVLECTRGSVSCILETYPTLDNASDENQLEKSGGIVSFAGKMHALHVQFSVPGRAQQEGAISQCELKAGERAFLVLTCTGKRAQPASPVSEEAVLQCRKETQDYWEEWSQSCTFQGEFRDAVVRSALALKLLIYEPTGAIVAAPTSSLPEWIGGKRNWDYRYSWLRDSSLTIVALMNVGYMGEARDFLRFLHQSLPPSASDYQIMYRPDGGTDMNEGELAHLEGYRHSRPVRYGNGAANQTQLDIFGEIAHCNYMYWIHPRVAHDRATFLETAWPVLQTSADFVCDHWSREGSGIWERRGKKRQYTASIGMCWVALDRVLKLASHFQMNSPHQQRWTNTRDEIYSQLLEHGYKKSVDAFVQAFDSASADASLLRFPLFDIVKADDYRMQGTVAMIERDLMKNGLVYRYRDGQDGMQDNEGTFTVCAFWLAENYVLQGRIREAEQLIRHVLSYSSELGLLSEEIDADTAELLGNYPQGFTHIGLINAAVRLADVKRAGKKQEEKTAA